jgi:RNA-directed DNA polymerase
MRRVRIELADIAAIPNLAEATLRASRGKRERPAVHAFLGDLEANLGHLANAILTGRAPRGEYRCFRINDPKPRRIHAACFPDRVLHHAIMRLAGPVLERAMPDTSFACRPGKGSLAAVRATQAAVRRFPWYVKIDVSGYFEHIDHAILLDLLARRFKGASFLGLLERVLLTYQSAPGRGLPIGSLTSQYFANHFLWARAKSQWPPACW